MAKEKPHPSLVSIASNPREAVVALGGVAHRAQFHLFIRVHFSIFTIKRFGQTQTIDAHRGAVFRDQYTTDGKLLFSRMNISNRFLCVKE